MSRLREAQAGVIGSYHRADSAEVQRSSGSGHTCGDCTYDAGDPIHELERSVFSQHGFAIGQMWMRWHELVRSLCDSLPIFCMITLAWWRAQRSAR